MFYCDTTANELIVPTKKTWDLFKDKYRLDKNIYIIPTGIEIERFYKEKIKKDSVVEVRKQLGLNDNDFVLLFVGRLGKEKNVDFLIEAQKDLITKIPNAKLVIIGDGPEREDFYNHAKKLKLLNNVIFTGMVPWEKVPIYYQLADIFVTASTTETQGLTVIEAMAAGVVPVCIDDESFRLTVVDGLNGKIFKNKRDYKNIIFNLYNDKKSLNNMARQARLNADLHSSKHYAESVLDVYKHAIESKKGPFGLISDIIEKVKK